MKKGFFAASIHLKSEPQDELAGRFKYSTICWPQGACASGSISIWSIDMRALTLEEMLLVAGGGKKGCGSGGGKGKGKGKGGKGKGGKGKGGKGKGHGNCGCRRR